MTSGILDMADLIRVMTPHHHDQVTSLLRHDHRDRIHLFMEYSLENPDMVPEDTGRQTEAVYQQVFDILEKGCREIVKKLEKQNI